MDDKPNFDWSLWLRVLGVMALIGIGGVTGQIGWWIGALVLAITIPSLDWD